MRVESAGVWWCSMPFKERIQYRSFHENQYDIEESWDKEWGDRKNEVVFIGQNLDKEAYRTEVESCLLTDEEAKNWDITPWLDSFPERI